LNELKARRAVEREFSGVSRKIRDKPDDDDDDVGGELVEWNTPQNSSFFVHSQARKEEIILCNLLTLYLMTINRVINNFITL
jgi:hypothetical protein